MAFAGADLALTYGFDDVAMAPAPYCIDPNDTEIDFEFDGWKGIPFLSAGMDSITSLDMFQKLVKERVLPVFNIEGIWGKYENPDDAFKKLRMAPDKDAMAVLKEIYDRPISQKAIQSFARQIKKETGYLSIAVTPPRVKSSWKFIQDEIKPDSIMIQSSATTNRYYSKSKGDNIIGDYIRESKAPVFVGNLVTYDAALEFFHAGATGVFVGVGPGSACTTREVLGIGVPQVSALLATRRARKEYEKETGRRVIVIADGGMRGSGDILKALVCGADAVMLGRAFARSEEAPGAGYHWGMAAPNKFLPRGTRISLKDRIPLAQILHGPAIRDDGTENLVGGLKMGMSILGSRTVHELSGVPLIYAPALQTEGKWDQLLQA